MYIYTKKYIYIYIYIYVYIYTCQFLVNYDVFRQCQWDASCRARRELSNALVKSDFCLTVVEIWAFPFRKGLFKGLYT